MRGSRTWSGAVLLALCAAVAVAGQAVKLPEGLSPDKAKGLKKPKVASPKVVLEELIEQFGVKTQKEKAAVTCAKELQVLLDTFTRDFNACSVRRSEAFDNASMRELGQICHDYGFTTFPSCLAEGAVEERILQKCREEAGISTVEEKAAECRKKEKEK